MTRLARSGLAAALLFAGQASASHLAPVEIPAKYLREGRKDPVVTPAHVSIPEHVESTARLAEWALRPTPKALGNWLGAKVRSPGNWRRVASIDDLASKNDAELGNLGRALLDTTTLQRLVPSERHGLQAQFERVLTAHGDDPADQLSILSAMGLSESKADRLKAYGLGDRVSAVYAAARKSIEGQGFGPRYQALIGKLGVTTAPGFFTTYADGPTAFTRTFDLMETAVEAKAAGRKAFIVNATFTLKPDAVGTKFAALLRSFARVGGDAYSIYEPVGSTSLLDGTPVDTRLHHGTDTTLSTRDDGTRYLEPGKVDDRTFYDRIVSPKGQSLKTVQLSSTAEAPLADVLSHRKATIVGFENENHELEIHVMNGDLNDSDEHLLWRGFQHEITGPAVKGSVDDMLELWKATTGRSIPDEVVRMMRTPQPEKPGMVPIGTLGHRGGHDVNIKNFFLATMDAMPPKASYIAAVPYNFDLDEFQATARIAARAAKLQSQGGAVGQKPIILVPANNTSPSVAAAFESEIPALLKAGVDVRFYNGETYLNGFSHSKRGAAFYEDPSELDANGKPTLKGVAYNGTSNWDHRSTVNNWEEDHIVQDPQSIGKIVDSLRLDLKESKALSLDAHGQLLVGGEKLPVRHGLKLYAAIQSLL